MYLITRWILFALAIMLVSWVVPGISVSGFFAALIVSVIIGLINATIRPLVYFVSLPINMLTLGLFSFVINALLLLLAGYITPGFTVSGFFSALIGSILLSLLGIGINNISEKERV